jgi:hypothetical protein
MAKGKKCFRAAALARGQRKLSAAVCCCWAVVVRSFPSTAPLAGHTVLVCGTLSEGTFGEGPKGEDNGIGTSYDIIRQKKKTSKTGQICQKQELKGL